MFLRLNDFTLKIGTCKLHSELIVGNIDRTSVGIFAVRGIIVRGSDGKAEIINSFGVCPVDGNLQHIVFVSVAGNPVFIVVVSDFIRHAVHFYTFRRGGVSQRYDPLDVRENKRTVISYTIMQNNIFCRRGILGKQRSRRSPLSQNFMKIISHFISVNSVDSSVLGRIILYIFFSVEFFNLGLILSSFDLTIFRRYIIFIEEEFEYVVGKFVFPFLIRRSRQIIRFFCRFII